MNRGARAVENPDGRFPQADTQRARARFLPATYVSRKALKLQIPGKFPSISELFWLSGDAAHKSE